MFCFCLQSSLQKLQALEVEGGTSLGSSPEESPPPLGSKEQKSPRGRAELGGKEAKTLALCHGVPADENSPPGTHTCQCVCSPRHPPLTAIHPGQQPPTPDVVPPPSPHHSPYSPQRSSPGGEGGHGPDGGGALLQLLAGGASPLPSPRCSSPCQRFNSDPDSAPSPPCSQQYILCRGDRTQDSEGERPSSVPFLTRHIQTLKKKVRRFEDQFEQDMNYKPSHNDKYSNPEMIRVMGELAKARKQLKGDGRRLSEQGSADVYGAGENHSAEMSAVLRESARPAGESSPHTPSRVEPLVSNGTKQEKNLVKPLYDRYQMIKHLLCASPTISTIEEEDGSDEDCVSSLAVDELPVPPPRRSAQPAAGEEDSDRDSDPAFVSPLDEVKAVRQQDALTTANLHEASRSQLLDCLRETRAEKKARRKVLKEFEDEFYRQTGRICQKEDRTPMKEEYQEYKQLKAKLRLLEVLLSKQEVAM
uniref:Protein FAM13C-like n=1 Tax=Neolamprologus brichardi TaxID=32507 RepID=A0A3Q4G1D0_NEOBR